MIYHYASRYGVRVFQSRVEGGQIQILLKAEEKKSLSDFLRVLAGRVAVTVSGAKKGLKRVGRFWDYLYWSRILSWGRFFYAAREFVSGRLTVDAIKTTADSSFEWICELTPS